MVGTRLSRGFTGTLRLGRWDERVRFGAHETRGPRLHAHFEAYDRPYGQGGRVIENTRVDIIPDGHE